MDKIFIRDLKIHGVLGVYESERDHEQEILINIVISTDTRRAGHSDRIEDCLNYHEMAKTIHKHVINIKRFTVEALAEDIAGICLEHPLALAASVRVEKPEALDVCDTVGVEIFREKKFQAMK